MDLFTFINNLSSENFLHQYKTICFKGLREKYPLLFFSIFFKQIKKQGMVSVETVKTPQEEPTSIFAKLSTSFLGNTSLYWLKNISEFKPKKSKQILDFLKIYSGPNNAVFFVDESALCKIKDFQLTVLLPEKIDQKAFEALAIFFEKSMTKIKSSQIFKKVRAVSLDDACLLMEYAQLSGRSVDDFTATWLNKIVEPEYSLIELSKQFFARDTKKFFSLWSTMSKDYSVQFWTVFWSEQLWRAYNFIEQSNKRQFLEAKRISFRLPFNFTKQLWRYTDKDELRKAHDFIYSVDCSQKNGGASFSLELFYTRFFFKHF
ncbi:hypothetical protein KAH94_02420 [bacterium]|nr:hypothetical protein [bacterium]